MLDILSESQGLKLTKGFRYWPCRCALFHVFQLSMPFLEQLGPPCAKSQFLAMQAWVTGCFYMRTVPTLLTWNCIKGGPWFGHIKGGNIGNFTTLLKPHNIGTHLKGIETSFQVVPLFFKSFHFCVSYITLCNFLKIPSVKCVTKGGTQKLTPKIKVDETYWHDHSLESSWGAFPDGTINFQGGMHFLNFFQNTIPSLKS
jgi:hypothetical protein